MRVVKVEVHHRGLIVSETQLEGAEAGARQRVVAHQTQAVPPDRHPPFELEIVCPADLFKTRQHGVEPDPDPVAGGADQEGENPQHPGLPLYSELRQDGHEDDAERAGQDSSPGPREDDSDQPDDQHERIKNAQHPRRTRARRNTPADHVAPAF